MLNDKHTNCQACVKNPFKRRELDKGVITTNSKVLALNDPH